MKYKYLDHTADASFIAYGKTLEECFANCAEAMYGIIVDVKKVKPKHKIEFEIKAKRTISLLYDFLSEFLYHIDKDGFLLSKIETIEIKGNKIKCVALGDNFRNYDMTGTIKSVTYNDMYVRETEKGWEARVVVDL